MKKVINSVIESDQTAYVPGRYIEESVRLISDILEFTEIHNISGYIITADIEEAFDSIEHNFRTPTLIKLGFSPNFIQWVKTLLYKQESCVMNNGHSIGFFSCTSSWFTSGQSIVCLFIHSVYRNAVRTIQGK